MENLADNQSNGATSLGNGAVKTRDNSGFIITGDGNTIFYGQSEVPIDWESINFQNAFDRASDNFIQHMISFAGAVDREDAIYRYVRLPIQDTNFSPTHSSRSVDESSSQIQQRNVFSWDARESSLMGNRILLIGENGAGKTTQLYYIGHSLSLQSKSPIPIFLSLSQYNGHHSGNLLEALAKNSTLSVKTIDGLFSEDIHPLFLIFDGADEISQNELQEFVSSLDVLLKKSPTNGSHHRIIFSSRDGENARWLSQKPFDLDFIRFEILPLTPTLTRELLNRYGLGKLSNLVINNFQSVIQTPDLLSALSQGLLGKSSASFPRSIGQIYELYVDSIFSNEDEQTFDYTVITREILGHIAVRMLELRRSRLIIEGELIEEIVNLIDDKVEAYSRQKEVAPPKWTLSKLFDGLDTYHFIDIDINEIDIYEIHFTKQSYRDYFAAQFMRHPENHERIIRALEADDREIWLNSLLIMSGLIQDSNELLERFYELSTDYATDMWMQTRQSGLKSPKIIYEKIQNRFEELKEGSKGNRYDPFTKELILKQLRLKGKSSRRYKTRFDAACAATQWGIDGIEALLVAVDDKHPIISAVAAYALLHLGETSLTGEGAPLEPLFKIEGRSFTFSNMGSGGGIIGGVGPITLISTAYGQSTNKTELLLQITNLDFDPFQENSNFAISHSGPVWFAHQWFQRKHRDNGTRTQVINWVELMAQLNHIVYLTNEAVQKARLNKSAIVPGLDLKLNLFLSFLRFLEEDLGCAPVQPDLQPRLTQESFDKLNQDYEQFRKMYSRNLRKKYLSFESDAHSTQYSQTIENVTNGAEVVMINMGDVSIQSNSPPTPNDRLYQFEMSQAIENLVDSSLTSMSIQSLYEGTELLPTYSKVYIWILIENMVNSDYFGVAIDNLFGLNGGLAVRATINIENFNSSEFHGVFVNQSIETDFIEARKNELTNRVIALNELLSNSPNLDGSDSEAIIQLVQHLVNIGLEKNVNPSKFYIYRDSLYTFLEEKPDLGNLVQDEISNIFAKIYEISDLEPA